MRPLLRGVLRPVVRPVVGRSANGGPLLDFNFDYSSLDPRITFARASSATYIDATGTLQTAPNDTPRFDYGSTPGTTPLGLLIEEQRTNTALGSGAIGGAQWAYSVNLMTVALNAAQAPDGTNTATLITETSGTGQHLIDQTAAATITVGDSWTFSMFIKASGSSTAFLTANGEGTAIFDLAAATASPPSGTVTATSAVRYPNGWIRCSATFTKSNTNTQIYVGASGSAGSYAGNPSASVYVWGAQFEKSASTSSYISTSGTAATRAADIPTTPTPPGYSGGATTLAAEAMTNNPSAPYFPALIQVDDGSLLNRMELYVKGGVPTFEDDYTNNTPDIILPTIAISAGVPFKVAAAVQNGRSAAVLNGGVPAVKTAAHVPTSLSNIAIGNLDGSNWFNGYIRRIRLWPRVLSDSELQAVTT